RHPVRRRAAALRRDLQRLCAPVPRSHGPAGGRPRRRRAAGDRDRPDQPGADLAFDGRHDDRAERSPEAAVRAPPPPLPPPQPAVRVRPATPEPIYAALLSRAAAAGAPRLVFTFPVELPADTTAEQQEQWLSASGFTRVQAERFDGGRKILDVVADRFRIAA